MLGMNTLSENNSYICGFSNSTLRNLLFTVGLGAALLITYNKCIECVIIIALISGITMTCIPTMPMVFILSCAVLLLHTIDYKDATIKVEVPLENFVYIPSWDDFHKYVHMSPGKGIDESIDSSIKTPNETPDGFSSLFGDNHKI